jgi:hypothetical protein
MVKVINDHFVEQTAGGQNRNKKSPFKAHDPLASMKFISV